MKLRLRVVGDGSGFNTRVFNAETGEEIEGVRGVSFSIDAMTSEGRCMPPTVTLSLYGPHEFVIDESQVPAAEPAA